MPKKLVVALLLVIGLTVLVGLLALRAQREPPAAVAPAAEAVAPPGDRGPPAPVAAPPPAAARPLPSGRPAPASPPPPAADQAALMEKLRALAGHDPEQILRLAREANARDPDGPDAPERAWMVVKSLVDLQRFSEAKDEAQTMVNRYPGTSWALDVQRHLLSNPL